ncbi:putative bifunctional diguanylate cyclase/phosphodiesterase [Sideroxydans lithotrophicus]|uniref:Diguanylate cyclase/phosphodiesterase with PAS/PAC and GAF sensor(S) n=1 Tax=Sideroxydans lithotrophicus (strain ES-1) TaxID=580332 RepID=D5CR34_SIDLE|nr:EAL domain-containing protein [Sideroxydans lithotrophicus]ADE11420.1 diguanylate cyclase/phosphodiesterase with PAS/PAC and GAF sensor(s) [Sideroxydans lithotrophicus ES-1]
MNPTIRLQTYPWTSLFILLVVLGAISAVAIQSKFDDDLKFAHTSATQQLQLISTVISSELNHGNYQNIGPLFDHWAKADASIVELQLVSANGFKIAEYLRFSPDRHILELDEPISYSYREEATARIRVSLEPVYRRQARFIAQFAGIFLAFSILAALLLYFALQSKKESSRARRITRLYSALSEINQAIVRMEQEEQLFPLVCRCAVKFGGMNMAWVAQVDKESKLLLPAASYGAGQDYLDGIVISPLADVPEGRGPVGVAFRENHPVIINDSSNDPDFAPWQNRASEQGWHSIAAFPIPRGGRPFAVLSVYHQHIDAFDGESIALLDEMSRDISFSLDNFDREVQRKAAEQSLQLAASIYENSSEGMMITDADNLIMAINPAFTRITGYAMEDVIGKNPGILKSGRHDMDFYQAMWNEILGTGKWIGEIWDRRKSGEVYPKWLTINTVFNDDGKVHHRIALFTDISQKKESEELIWRQANFDHLTGLPNWRMFHDRLEQEIKKSRRVELPLAVVFLDLDHFKEVNDTMGHATGDLLLKEAALRLSSCVRESDTVARLGGDEFALLLGELSDQDSIERVNECILNKFSAPFQLGNELAYISVSIGVTIYPSDATEIEALLRNADQAMYAAKNSGRNRSCYYTQAMQSVAQNRMSLSNDLHKALAQDQFRLVYQPIVELETGSIHKAEALIRWQHPNRGLVSPADFIPIAEQSGLIIQIGDWVFRQAANQVKHWRGAYGKDIQISINKSPVQFKSDSNTHLAWFEHLKELDLSGGCFAIEITESLLMDASDTIVSKLMAFGNIGMQVALDDFGTGYSSLSYLKKFDIDYIKIDQSFVRNLAPDSSDLALCEAMIMMAHKLGIKVIAEGVETSEQRDLLRTAGCDYGQGYLFSRPLSTEDFEGLVWNASLYRSE